MTPETPDNPPGTRPRTVRSLIDEPAILSVRCADGDIAMHVRFPLLGGEMSILDTWYLEDGDQLTVTNRVDQLPPWFSLYPTEVSGPLCLRMSEQFARGDHPPAPVDVGLFWRVKVGDLFVMTFRKPRDNGADTFVFEPKHGTAVFAEPRGLEDYMGTFRPPAEDPLPADVVERLSRAVNAARRGGQPRIWAESWTMEL